MTQSIYDAIATRYDFSTLQTPYFAHLSARYREILTETRPKFRLDSILDIGCGTGLFNDVISQGASHYVGIDVSEKMLRIARDRSNRTEDSGGISLLRADAAFIPIKTNGVDGTASIGMVLPHLSSYANGLSEVSRVLRAGGRFWLELDNKWSVDLLHYLADALTLGKFFEYGFPALSQIQRYVRSGNYEWNMGLDGLPTSRKILLHKISVNESKRLLKELRLKIERIFGVHIVTLFLPKTYPREHSSLAATYIRTVTWLDRHVTSSYPFALLGGSIMLVGTKSSNDLPGH